MNNFVYDIPTKVYFGKDEELNVGKYLKEFGATKVLLHYGGHSAEKSGLLGKVRKAMDDEGIPFVELGGVRANPSIELVRKGVKLAIDEKVDFILAVGGGSVMDSSKAIAHGAANPGVDERKVLSDGIIAVMLLFFPRSMAGFRRFFARFNEKAVF